MLVKSTRVEKSQESLLYHIHLVCQMVQQGVAAIVGPTDPIVAAHVQSMAEALKVPHIETRLELFVIVQIQSKSTA